MDKRYDLIVVGTGVAATQVARRCRAADWRVAIVDMSSYGGTCALAGCDPKKVLVGAAELIDSYRRLLGRGIAVERCAIDWADLMRFKRSFTEPVPARVERRLRSLGIDTYHGVARFTDRSSLRIGAEDLEARYVYIATGAKARELAIAGREHVISSDQFLDLESLPRRIAFIGGGYISFEFAHIAARAGAEPTILDHHERPLRRFDPDLVSLLLERSRDLGIKIELQATVRAVQRTARGYVVLVVRGSEEITIEADLVVHGAGRIPNIDALDLEKASVLWGARGVLVNEYLQSVSNPAVYAGGDAAASGPPLTPVASFDATVVTQNLLEGPHRKVDYPPIPSTVFTIPPLARLGLLEEQARQNGLRFNIHHELTHGWYSARRIAEPCSAHKLLVEQGSGRILGAHLIGPSADEQINLFALAMANHVPAGDVKRTIFAYPTLGSDISSML